MKDERIQQSLNKIRSEMTILILLGVALSFLVKTFVFNMSLGECITEYLILILAPLYQFIRMHMLKIGLYSNRGNKQSTKTIFLTISIFIAASAIFLLKKIKESSIYNWQNPVIFLSIFLILFIAIYLITNKFNQQMAQKYEEHFDDDNNL